MNHQRLIPLSGTVNFRDGGGYPTSDGAFVRWGQFYRSDSLSRLSEADQNELQRLNVTVDCDLRSLGEQKDYPDRLWPQARFFDCHIYPESQEEYQEQTRKGVRFWRGVPKMTSYLDQIYQRVLLTPVSQRAFTKVFEQLLTLPEDQALVYHCSAGKDRTGIVSTLLLMALGVSDDLIARDYMLTNKLYDFAWQKQHPTADQLSQTIAKMNVTQGDATAVLGLIKTIRVGWGSFDAFFVKALGFKKSQLEQLRKRYLTSTSKA